MGDTPANEEAFPTSHDVFKLTTRNRLMIADFLEGLSEEQWRAPTLCDGWDVHTMAAHFLQPMLVGFGRFFVTALRYRGDTDMVVDHVTRRLARHSRQEILRLLRAHADDQVDPPRVGPMGPFAETCIHLRDIARPMGSKVDVPTDHWTALLDYMVHSRAAAAIVSPGRLDGLRLQATDAAWSAGRGLEITGTAEGLGMAASGRRHALADLDGPGAEVLDMRFT